MGKTWKVFTAAILFITWTMQSPAQNPIPAKPDSALSLDVNLVLINATVTEHPTEDSVLGLNKENFQIWEDKTEQNISYFSSEDIPVSVGIVFDISGSMKDKVASAQQAAATFFKSGTTEDEYFVIQFSDRPQIASDFTTDVTILQNRLFNVAAKGKTSLYDAVYLGLNKLKESRNAKKALLLITDGEDNHSRYTFANVRESAREKNVEIYAVGVLSSESLVGRAALLQLTQITGGRAFFPLDRSDISTYCQTIAKELKRQYVLGYYPTNTARDGSWRKIRIKVNTIGERSDRQHPLEVRARSGYYGPRDSEPVKTK